MQCQKNSNPPLTQVGGWLLQVLFCRQVLSLSPLIVKPGSHWYCSVLTSCSVYCPCTSGGGVGQADSIGPALLLSTVVCNGSSVVSTSTKTNTYGHYGYGLPNHQQLIPFVQLELCTIYVHAQFSHL